MPPGGIPKPGAPVGLVGVRKKGVALVIWIGPTLELLSRSDCSR